jgi:hypothetical protein
MRPIGILASTLLSCCAPAADTSGNEAPGDPAETLTINQNTAVGSSSQSVFVAVRTGAEGYGLPEARPTGSFRVENGCLVFGYKASPIRTPILPPGSSLSMTEGAGILRIGAATVPLGVVVSVSGGSLPDAFVKTKTPIPDHCPQKAMLVGEVI